jgi:pimeloyl-ACP methyl ester carboxylesterase
MPKMNLFGFEMNYEIYPGVLPMDTIFMHGNLASNAWWKPALEIWKSQSNPRMEGRAIFAEWRGSGDSAAPVSEDALTMETLAQDYNNLLEQLNVSKACLVGHSTGGLIGLLAMLKKPSLYHRAFLLDPVAADGVVLPVEVQNAFTGMSKDRDLCAAVLGSTILNNDSKSTFFQSLVDDAFRISKHNWLGVPRALTQIDITAQLAEITQPVCVAHGEHDTLLPKEKSVAMASSLPHGQFLEIKGHGHCTNVENPELFVSLVNSHLFQ